MFLYFLKKVFNFPSIFIEFIKRGSIHILIRFKNKIDDCSLFSEHELNKMRKATLWVNGLKYAFGYDPTLCKCGTQNVIKL